MLLSIYEPSWVISSSYPTSLLRWSWPSSGGLQLPDARIRALASTVRFHAAHCIFTFRIRTAVVECPRSLANFIQYSSTKVHLSPNETGSFSWILINCACNSTSSKIPWPSRLWPTEIYVTSAQWNYWQCLSILQDCRPWTNNHDISITAPYRTSTASYLA